MHFEDARWPSLAGSILSEAMSGSPYAFGVFGEQLRQQLNLTETEEQQIGM
jgi:hypothetical protein